MKKVAWIIYFVLIILLTALLWINTVALGATLILPIISTIFTTIYLRGLYGYINCKAYWSPTGWRFVFWLNLVATSLQSLKLFSSPTLIMLADVIITALFSLPMLYALYKYSLPSFEAWANTATGKEAALLSTLLNNNEQLETSVTSSTTGEEVKTNITLSKEEDEFVVKISKTDSKGNQSFTNNFSSLDEVVVFLENNTTTRAANFA